VTIEEIWAGILLITYLGEEKLHFWGTSIGFGNSELN